MSDPNDIIKNAKLPEEKGFTPTPDSFMGRVDKAGGIEAYEEAKKFMDEVSKVKPEQWTKLTETFKVVKGFLDVETDVFTTMKDEIVNSLKIKTEELLAPIKNEITEQTNKILEPLLPFINEIVNNIIVPVIQWIADKITIIINLVQADFNPWEAAWSSQAVQWLLANPGKNLADYLAWVRAQNNINIPDNTYGRLVE